ncbi:MAG TPA: membrane protein insertase YidC [Bacteroidales bacterium]|nr:MAG: hypothetical protein A2X11_14970 [Bacteroidetes bacterium GWE2_42_24]OFY31648.1 MAG: hypothetical protein A2X09_08715 [Bacteroidetes bacterium GWF2_43_11]HAQ64458.1 membrane protein insertase YidC [Bacteroidales bacterium]HBZ67091.1 membrane protein insertase YidC [Bacteroidales bacterium]
MDRNTIFGLLLIFGIFIGWGVWMTPSKEEAEKQRQMQDSIMMTQVKTHDSLTRIAASKPVKPVEQALAEITSLTDSNVNDTIRRELKARFGNFSQSAVGEKKTYTIENDLVRIDLNQLGGRPWRVELKDYQTYDTLPVILFDSATSAMGLEFFSQSKLINTNQFYFKPFWYNQANKGKTNLSVTGSDSLVFGMRLYADASDTSLNPGSYIEFKYTLKGNKYMIGFDAAFVGMGNVIDKNTTFVNLNWKSDLRTQEQSLENEQRESTVYYRFASEKDVSYLSETKDDKESLGTSVKWISYKALFFTSVLLADKEFEGAEIQTYTKTDKKPDRYLKSMSAVIPLTYQSSGNTVHNMRLYYGPNKYRTLRNYHIQLERQITLGWGFAPMWIINVYAVIPVFDWLESWGLTYGIIILILTVLLKTFLFPIAYWSYRATAKMKVLKPEIEEITKKFTKSEDSMKKQQATMDLYRKAGVNPMAGCIPMLLQFPILIALFRFFPSSIELRQQSFLWAHDLSSYDSIFNLPFDIPFYGDHVSLFTLLMTVSTIIYTKMNNDMMSTGSQMPGMKTMMYIMPVMFLGIFNNYASGLSYYYLLANLFTFAQMWVIRRTINEKKLLLKLQENKKKPVKKSGFQRRLEEMAKQQGVKK